MKKMGLFYIFLLIGWIAPIGKEIYPAVDPPNYNFNIDELESFMPTTPLSKIPEKYGKGVMINRSKGKELYQFFIQHLRFKFPILIQLDQGEISDFYCPLPSYFLHDIFLQSLVKKYGKQDLFKKVGEEAVYVWNGKEGKDITYMASCTITCFPVSLAVAKAGLSPSSPSLLQSMNE